MQHIVSDIQYVYWHVHNVSQYFVLDLRNNRVKDMVHCLVILVKSCSIHAAQIQLPSNREGN